MMTCIFYLSGTQLLKNELDTMSTNKFYLSGTMIEPNSGHIKFNCGENINNFDENKLLQLTNLTIFMIIKAVAFCSTFNRKDHVGKNRWYGVKSLIPVSHLIPT